MNLAKAKQLLNHPGCLKWGTFTAVILYFLLFVVPSLMGLPLGDEGIYILQSMLMHQGALPYRDFSAGIFPAILYFGSTVFDLLGPSISGLRMVMFALLVITAWLTLKMGRPYLTRKSSFLLILFFALILLPTTFAFTHHLLSGPLSLWAIYGVSRYLKTRQRRFLAIAGLSTACVLLATQSLGVLLGGGLAGFLGLYFYQAEPTLAPGPRGFHAAQKVTLLFVIPFLIPLALAFGAIAGQGLWTDFYKETILWIFQGTYAKSTSFLYFATGFLEFLQPMVIKPENGSLIILWQALPLSFAYILVAWLPVFGLLWAIEVFLRKLYAKHATDWQLLLLILGTGILLASSMTYSTSYHIGLNAWTGYLLATIALQALFKTPWLQRHQLKLYGIALIYLLYTFGYQTKLNFSILEGDSGNTKVHSYGTVESTFAHPLGPDAAHLDALVVEMIRNVTKPGDPVFIFSATPYLYILADRPMATRFFMLYPIINSDAQIQEAVRALQAKPPKVIVDDMKLEPMIKTDHRLAQYRNLPPVIPGLDALLKAQYKAYQISHYRVYIKQP